ncbi:hypothetical protein [Mesorhizobium sp. Cs1321R2N1]|uniref:hypothetical protein n=1 Tax=Mesorhizobium sp. Cs1321R2N1 TaxID=3015174 RepID=UPI00301E42BA
MRDLAHDGRAMAMDSLRQRLKMGDDAIARKVQLTAAQLESGEVIAEPPAMVIARPPRAFSSW